MDDNKKLTEVIKVIAEKEICGKQFRVWNTPEEPLFLAKDVAIYTGYTGRAAVSHMLRIVNDKDKLKLDTTVICKGKPAKRNVYFITEQGLYKVLMRSDKPNAAQFQDKVCEILKEIRQTGGYIVNSQEMTDDELLMKALDLAQRKINSRVKQIEC